MPPAECLLEVPSSIVNFPAKMPGAPLTPRLPRGLRCCYAAGERFFSGVSSYVTGTIFTVVAEKSCCRFRFQNLIESVTVEEILNL